MATPTVVTKVPVFLPSPLLIQTTKDGATWLFSGERVYRSVDGGGRWADASPTIGSGGPQVAFALDAERAMEAIPSYLSSGAVNGVTLYGTADGGVTWQKLGTASITGSLLTQLTFVDSAHGWLLVSLGAATGSEAVAVWGTTDGGHSWSELARSPMPQQNEMPGQLSSGCDKNGISFLDDTTGWVTAECAGGSPFVERSVDGGRNWHTQDLAAPPGHTSAALRSLGYGFSVMPPVFPDRTFGLLPVELPMGNTNPPLLVIYVTRDGGQTWIPTTPITSGRVMAAPRAGHWIVIVPPREVVSTENGQQYAHISSDTDLTLVEQISFADDEHGVALLAQASGGYRLLRTADGGAQWTQVTIGG